MGYTDEEDDYLERIKEMVKQGLKTSEAIAELDKMGLVRKDLPSGVIGYVDQITKLQADAEMYKMAMQASGGSVHNHAFSTPSINLPGAGPTSGPSVGQSKKRVLNEKEATQLIHLRMRWPGEMLNPFAHLSFFMGKEKATVFVVTRQDEKAVTLEDDINLFPSDTLIGQLHFLLG